MLAGDKVFLNVGTHAAIPHVPGLEAARPLTNIEALDLDYLPPYLIVLGGGYVGLEFRPRLTVDSAARITIIQSGPQIMTREDPDVAAEVQGILTGEGIQILVAAETLHVHGRSGDEVRFVVRTGSGERKIEASDILVATGRIPNTAAIGLEKASVELDGRGYIRVNERLETSASEVWAIGECARAAHKFTHVSADDLRIIKENLGGGKRSTRDRLIPYCMFTDPPLARVGLTESEAQRQGIAARVGQTAMSAVLRAQTTDENQGFMKALIGDDDRVLGFTMIGSEAGEVIAAVQTAMLANLKYSTLRDAVLAHPTAWRRPSTRYYRRCRLGP